MQKCRQTPCPSSPLGNPSSAHPWLLKGGSAALWELLAVELTPFPSHGCQQMPEDEANTGVPLQVYLWQGLFLTCRKAALKIPKKCV